MSSAPLTVSDLQLSAILRACDPLPPPDREPFLFALADLLRGEPQPLGDGSVFRAVRSLQREFFQPPRGMLKAPEPHRRRVGEPIE
jgi:hypothetical protein